MRRWGRRTERASATRQLVLAVLLLLVVALVLAAGFVSCRSTGPDDLDDPTVHGRHPCTSVESGRRPCQLNPPSN